jgi:hypothetical protein
MPNMPHGGRCYLGVITPCRFYTYGESFDEPSGQSKTTERMCFVGIANNSVPSLVFIYLIRIHFILKRKKKKKTKKHTDNLN